MELEQQKNSFEIKNELQSIIFEEFFVVSDGNYEINKKFNSKKYYGISKYLKVVMGNIEALSYQKEKINGNMLVSSEDKEVINSIYSLLFEKNYYGAFLKEFFEDEAKDIEVDSKDDFLEKLDTKLTGKEKYLNILTFGVLDKSYSNGELNAGLVLKLLKNFSKRLSIEKDFLVKYKLIEVEDKPDYEEILKEDIKNIVVLINNTLLQDDFQDKIKEHIEKIDSGDFQNINLFFEYIEYISKLRILVNQIASNEKIMNNNLILYKAIDKVNKLYNSMKLSSLPVKINKKLLEEKTKLSSKKSDIEEKEVTLGKIELLKTISENYKEINRVVNAFSKKQKSSFGILLKQIESIVYDDKKYKKSDIQKTKDNIEILKSDLVENILNPDIAQFKIFDVYEKQIEKKELYSQIINEIDNGDLFKVYIGILRYKLNFKEDKDLNRILKYINEKNIVSNFYKNLFKKLKKGNNISSEMNSMKNFLLLVENGSFESSNMDLENIKDDLNDLRHLFEKNKTDNDNCELELSSEYDFSCWDYDETQEDKSKIKNTYIESLIEDFKSNLIKKLKLSLNGDLGALNYLLSVKNIAYVKEEYGDLIDTIENIGENLEQNNQFLNKMFLLEKNYQAAKNILEEYFKKNIDKIADEVSEFINGYLKAIVSKDLGEIDRNKKIYKEINKNAFFFDLRYEMHFPNNEYEISQLFYRWEENYEILTGIYNFLNSSNTKKIKIFNENKALNNSYEVLKILRIDEVDLLDCESTFYKIYKLQKDENQEEILSDIEIDINEILSTKNKSYQNKSKIQKLKIITKKIKGDVIIGKINKAMSRNFYDIIDRIEQKKEDIKQKKIKENHIKLGLENDNSIFFYENRILNSYKIPKKYAVLIANTIAKKLKYHPDISEIKLNIEKRYLEIQEEKFYIFENQNKENAIMLNFDDYISELGGMYYINFMNIIFDYLNGNIDLNALKESLEYDFEIHEYNIGDIIEALEYTEYKKSVTDVYKYLFKIREYPKEKITEKQLEKGFIKRTDTRERAKRINTVMGIEKIINSFFYDKNINFFKGEIIEEDELGTVYGFKSDKDEKHLAVCTNSGFIIKNIDQTEDIILSDSGMVGLYSDNYISFNEKNEVVYIGKDGNVILRNLEKDNGEIIYSHEDKVNTVQFSPDGNYIVSGGDDNITIYNTKKKKIVNKNTQKDLVSIVAFSLDSKYIFSSNQSGDFRLYDIKKKKNIITDKLKQINLFGDQIISIDFSPDKKYAIFGDNCGRIFLFDMQTQEIKKIDERNEVITTIKFSPDSRFFYVGLGTGYIVFYDLYTENVKSILLEGTNIYDAKLSNNQESILVGTGDGLIKYKFQTRKESYFIKKLKGLKDIENKYKRHLYNFLLKKYEKDELIPDIKKVEIYKEDGIADEIFRIHMSDYIEDLYYSELNKEFVEYEKYFNKKFDSINNLSSQLKRDLAIKALKKMKIYGNKLYMIKNVEIEKISIEDEKMSSFVAIVTTDIGKILIDKDNLDLTDDEKKELFTQ